MKPAEAEAEITRELAPHERLLWSGTPKQGFLLRTQDAFLIPFSLVPAGFMILWAALTIGGHIPRADQLLGAAFVAMGLYMFAGRFFVDLARRARTAYGLTNRRIIIVNAPFGRRVTAQPLEAIREVHLFERRDGRGTLVFGAPAPRRFYGWSLGDPPWSPSFERIDGVRAVHEMLLVARSERIRASSAP